MMIVVVTGGDDCGSDDGDYNGDNDDGTNTTGMVTKHQDRSQLVFLQYCG